MGCGWLGLPLAKLLLEKGYSVRGTTTSTTKTALLEDSGIAPHVISLNEDGIEGDITSFLKEMDILVINVPPALRTGNSSSYVLKMKHLHRELKSAGISKVLFVSSTSVYGSASGELTEDTTPNPDSESGRQLLRAEELFHRDQSFKTTIVRFGGLIGQGRHPAIYLSGRKGLKNGHHPVNLIHLEDCLRLIISILEQGWWGDIFNGVYPDHPSKKAYYTAEAEKMGLQAPEYVEETPTSAGKTVKSVSLGLKGFTFSKGIWS